MRLEKLKEVQGPTTAVDANMEKKNREQFFTEQTQTYKRLDAIFCVKLRSGL
jgi:hypothetical protein